MFCSHCGHEVSDEAVVCIHCGCMIDRPKQTNRGIAQNIPSSNQAKVSGLKIAAKVFMIISVSLDAVYFFFMLGLALVASAPTNADFLSLGFMYLIPLIWQIPMLGCFLNKIRNGEPISIGFKVCTLIFFSLIAGILLLCDQEDYENNNNTTLIL